jgi:hypothetical protein
VSADAAMRIVQCIRDYRVERGVSPTLREMAERTQIPLATLFRHCRRLMREHLVHEVRQGKRKLDCTHQGQAMARRADVVLADVIDPKPFDADGFSLLREALMALGDAGGNLAERIEAYLRRVNGHAE